MLRTPECLDDRSAYGLAMGTLDRGAPRSWALLGRGPSLRSRSHRRDEATEHGITPLADAITKWAATLR